VSVVIVSPQLTWLACARASSTAIAAEATTATIAAMRTIGFFMILPRQRP
jgi:hypothetical protein